MSKFTKGPWLIEGDNFVYALRNCIWNGKPSKENSFSFSITGKAPKEEIKANANLIASSPMMYEALREALEWILNDGYSEECEIVTNIRMALAKAEGKE